MRTSSLVRYLGLALTATACNSNVPAAPAPAPPKELWRGYTIGDEYWVQVVAHEDMGIKGPRGERGFGVADGYQWEIGWGETDGVAIGGRRLSVNGRLRGDVLKRGDRIQVNASTGQVTVNGLAWK
jgi:hypothetical protein